MNIQTKNVSVPRANQKDAMESYFAIPEGSGPFPGIIVIHEIFGLNDNIRDITRRFANEGYAALERYEIPHDIKVYENSKHSFFNDTRPNFNPEASKDAWERMLKFLDEHLVKA
jgi:dienelactone hydrolase